MKEIPLTKGYVAVVDDEDYEHLARYRWGVALPEGRPYAVRHQRHGAGRREVVYMHRVIAGARPGRDVDHRNHDTLDNRRTNLRECEHRQNTYNARAQRGARSPYKGVSLEARTGAWVAYITVGGRRRFLGSFGDEQSAAVAYDDAARESFGEFAYLNFPDGAPGAVARRAKPPPVAARPCAFCNGLFRPTRGQLRRGAGRYCSPACYWRARSSGPSS